MGMVVRTNTMALNAYRQLGMNNSAVSKSLEKLSSGFRINRAADDAAGLAISEKMKAQIKGLETASANAQDGISLLQTAEGNLSEVHNMLNRMVELATKSANGTYSLTERTALQDEVDALLDEVNRISKSANFNGINLLDGSMGLNGDTFKLAGPTAAADGTPIELKDAFPSKGTNDATLHLGGTTVAEQKPYFEIDLGDFAIESATTGTSLTLSIGGVTVDSSAFSAAKTTAEIATDLAAKLNAKNEAAGGGAGVNIGNVLYTATAVGNKIKFEYAGDPNKAGTSAATDPIVTSGANPMTSPTNTVSLVEKGAGGNLTIKGSVNHNTINVTNPVAANTPDRAGIDFTLDANLIADGNKLTIDGKTFVFKTAEGSSVTAGSGEVLIDITDPALNVDLTDDDEKLAAIVDLLSKQETDNFKIEGSVDANTIHIDQKVGNKNTYATYESLTGLFSAQTASTAAGNKLEVKGTIKDGDSLTIGGKTYTFSKDGTGTNDKVNYVKVGANSAESLTNLQAALKDNGVKADVTADSIIVYGEKVAGGGLTLQIGDTAADFNKMTVAVNDMSASGLGIAGLDIKTANSASDAIDTIKTAINTVSSTRAGMGALQNRLEYTINNLDVAVENLSAANSRIRDTDMAKEMMNYTKMNVLVQSAQAMLAQANQQPQSVLQLLQ